ncbi:MAG: molecular chaperone HtpG [Flavobacteriales bacterium]|nr:molecular chaperone HtpG [Flavobacteriales bacterium]|tara:strand:+ start:5874 stop:7742 length:1869 start_codon:yes stop_codon:yes gene_type:complete
MSKGKIKVQAENIFPIIKKFLYTDQEIFLRELVSNAVDATTKLKKLSSIGSFKGDLNDLTIEIVVNKKDKTISIIDKGIGMSRDEVKQYINQVAFSGAEDFLKKYEDKNDKSGIIGHFGLGFYSAFMVAEKVQIITKSHIKKEKGCFWECDGSPEYNLKEHDKQERGTEIKLFIDKDSEDYLEETKLSNLLSKYCKFLPVEIKFGTKTKKEKNEKGEEVDVVEDNIINNPNPAWTIAPKKLKDEDYKNFYKELYPFNFDDPLFHIHLNVDFPFELTGVLYFPKINAGMDLNRQKIQLYCNQVFVTDSLEGVVPDFLALLQGVIDSPDIPLNVSRSALQSDSNVKKISSHISKKVSDRLKDMFKKDRPNFEKKWSDMNIIVEYGMLSDDKFYDRSQEFALYRTVEEKYYTISEFSEHIKDKQKDKDDKTIYLYTNNLDAQHMYVSKAQEKGYEVLVLDSPIVSHVIQKLESKLEKASFVRVDSDIIDNLIKKDEKIESVLSEEDQNKLKPLFEKALPKEGFIVSFDSLSPNSSPIAITQSEFMRRMKEMSMTGGGPMMGMGNMPDSYNLVVNSNHKLINKINGLKGKAKSNLIKQSIDLALLANNLLKGEELTKYINNSFKNL